MRLSDIGLDADEIRRLAGIYDVTELATAVKPLLLRCLLDERRGRGDLPRSGHPLYGSLDTASPAGARARHRADAAHDASDAARRTAGRRVLILAAGVYNLGFIAVGAPARPFLEWWWEQTQREALIDVARMMFTDQRVGGLRAGALRALHPEGSRRTTSPIGICTSATSQCDGDGYVVNGEPLTFFHFSGFDIGSRGC